MALGLAALAALLGACTGERATLDSEPTTAGAAVTTDPATTAPATTDPPTTEETAAPSTEAATTEPETIRASTTSSTSSSTSTTTTIPATTTTVAPIPGQPNPACILVVQSGDSLETIVVRLANPAVTVQSLATENAIADPNRINAEDPLDICPGNGVDDITGQPWEAPPPPSTVAPVPGGGTNFGSGVQAQQQKLNELFAGTGFPALTVDGDSGRYTRRALCAARLALGLPASRDGMDPGGAEEQALMAAGSLGMPSGAPTSAWRWALIDQTCQVMFVGEGSNRIVFLFPTSTGLAEFPTRNQQASRAFRYDPAVANGGWHDSFDYPAGPDNPLNGNMYKPIYFDRGQAIHGANNVPPEPRSHGCARLRVGDQDALVLYLGLADVQRETWNGSDLIELTVTIQGHY